jgi:hypothetical protein
MEEEAEQFLSCHLTGGNFFSTVWTYIDVVHISYMALLRTTLCYIYILVCIFFNQVFFMWLIFYFLH